MVTHHRAYFDKISLNHQINPNKQPRKTHAGDPLPQTHAGRPKTHAGRPKTHAGDPQPQAHAGRPTHQRPTATDGQTHAGSGSGPTPAVALAFRQP
jgi:hypothetical protein